MLRSKVGNRSSFVLAVTLALVLAVALLFVPADVYAVSVAKVSGVKATACNKTVTISWNQAAGASKYQVYRSKSLNGAYKRIKTTASLKYKDTGRGGSYYYKVRGISGSKAGVFSSKKRGFGGIEAYIAGSIDQTTIAAGPVTTIQYRIRNNTEKPIYMLGSTKDAKTGNFFSWLLYSWDPSAKQLTSKIAQNTYAYLSTADGGIDVYYSVIPAKKSRYVYISFMFTGGYARYINNPDSYYCAVFPAFSPNKPTKNDPLKISNRFFIGGSNQGFWDCIAGAQ